VFGSLWRVTLSGGELDARRSGQGRSTINGSCRCAASASTKISTDQDGSDAGGGHGAFLRRLKLRANPLLPAVVLPRDMSHLFVKIVSILILWLINKTLPKCGKGGYG
jgi:hypothetical protein